MAKLPRYEQQQITELAPAPKPVNLEAGVQTANVINRSLDQLIGYAKEGAERYAKESAIAFNIDNALTPEDYEKAKTSGEDPIKAFKTGGMVYNDTLRKLYANQASTQLLADAQDNHEDVLARVERGEITDKDEVKRLLTDPLKGYSSVIQRMDPATAATFQYRANYYGHTYFRRAVKELDNQAQFAIEQTLDKRIEDAMKFHQTQLSVYNSPQEILDGRKILEQDLADVFKQSGKPKEALNALRNGLDTIEEAVLSNNIAQEAFKQGISVEQMTQDLSYGNAYSNSRIFQDKLKHDQVKIIAAAKTAHNNLTLKTTTNKSAVNKLLSDGESMLSNLEFVNLNQYTPYVASMDEEQRTRYNMLQAKQSLAKQMMSMTETELSQYSQQVLSNKPEEMTTHESDLVNFVTKTTASIKKKIKDDPVGYMQSHPKYQGGTGNLYIERYDQFSEEDIANLKHQFGQRQEAIKEFKEDYNSAGDVPMFSGAEVNYFKQQLDNADPDTMFKMMVTFSTVFEGDKYELFAQLDKKQPGYGQIGGILANYMDVPGDLRDPEYSNARTLINAIVDEREMAKIGTKKSIDMSKTDVTQAQDDYFNGANMDSTEMAATIAAANLIYKHLAPEVSSFDSDLYTEALNMAIGKIGDHGGIVEYNNKGLYIPAYLTEDKLETIMDEITLEDIQNHAVTPDGIRADIGNYELRQFKKADLYFESRDIMVFHGTVDKKKFGIDGNEFGIDMPALINDLIARGVDI